MQSGKKLRWKRSGQYESGTDQASKETAGEEPASKEQPIDSSASLTQAHGNPTATGTQTPHLLSSSAAALAFPLDPHEDAFGLGAGDSFLIANFLSKAEADLAYRAMLPSDLGGEGELAWVQMYSSNGQPVPRLKNTQTELSSAGLPIYRYPINNQNACQAEPWSETPMRLCLAASEVVGHPLNHCVGNLYRNQNDSIGAHKDKMLDILEGSHIVSISFGAERPVVLESATGVQQVVPLRHGSLFVIGPNTNKTWTHAIPRAADRCGPRISLTIRQMGSFLDPGSDQIVGQGAEYQEKNWPFGKHDLSVLPTVPYPRRLPLDKEVVSQHSEGGSTFDCKLIPCVTPADVERIWQQICQEQPNACHIPHAWICRRQRPQPLQPSQGSRRALRTTLALQGWENHGEPCTGRVDTAHDSIFTSLEKSGLTDCMAVVVRHWDGERLGLKRLVEAYEMATLLAIDKVKSLPTSSEDKPISETVRNPSPEQIMNPDSAEVRKLKKALREIGKLEEQLDSDAPLQWSQLRKIERKQQIVERLHELEGPGLLPDLQVAKPVEDVSQLDPSADRGSEMSANAKEERKLRKALRDINALEQQQKQGETLRVQQVSKIQRKSEYAQRLLELTTLSEFELLHMSSAADD